MKDTLLKFESELRSIGAPVLKYFNDGLSREKIIDIFDEIHLKPTEDVIELFEWKNGTLYEDIPTGKINFGENGCLLPLEDLRRTYLFAMIDKIYPKTFFPILTSDDFLINLDESSKDYKKIFIYCPGLLILKPITCFNSLPRMFETFAEGFRQKVLWYGKDEYFTYDYKKYFALVREMNPNSRYWKRKSVTDK